jgi:hypothetical protein
MIRPVRCKLRDYAERLVKGDQHRDLVGRGSRIAKLVVAEIVNGHNNIISKTDSLAEPPNPALC